MKQELSSSSFSAFLNKVLSWSSSVVLMFICLEENQALCNSIEIPGLAIARFALPSIPTNGEVVNITGTRVGEKVAEIRHILQGLENETASMVLTTRETYEQAIAEVNFYYLVVGEIEATLQLGTTPANPRLIELRNDALHQLDQIAGTIATMGSLTAGFDKDSQQVKDLFSHIEATLLLPGAVDEDHAHLILMSDELTRVDGAIARIINIMNTNAQRQSEWLSAERVRFASLSSSIDRGKAFPQGSTPKLNYPTPILPDLGSPTKKTSHPHPQKKHVKKPTKKTDKTEPSSKSGLAPLPLASPQETPKDGSTGKTPVLRVEPPQPLPNTPRSEELTPLKQKPLPTVAVAPHPKAQPLPEQEGIPHEAQAESLEPLSQPQAQVEPSEPVSYSAATKNRVPLGLLEAHQDPRSQKWYLFSSVKRGIKGPGDVVEIVNVVEGSNPSKRGEEVKRLLIEMGLKPEQLQLINTKADEGQTPGIYIYKD